MHTHNTKSAYSKIFEVNHSLAQQVAIAGDARGEYTIQEGDPPAHTVVFELLKIDIVWRVVCDRDYLMVTVSEPHRWSQRLGEIQQTIMRHLGD
jgi:hypothetical protein